MARPNEYSVGQGVPINFMLAHANDYFAYASVITLENNNYAHKFVNFRPEYLRAQYL